MANKFVTFLEHVGHDIRVGIEDVLKFVTKFSPLIGVALSEIPGAGQAAVDAFNSTVAAVTLVEKQFAAIGQQSGTGAQKLAAVTEVLGTFLGTYLKSTGSKLTAQEYINYVVNLLNAFPAPMAAQPLPAQTTVPAAAATAGQ